MQRVAVKHERAAAEGRNATGHERATILIVTRLTIDPLTTRVPALTAVGPVYVLEFVDVKAPVPAMVDLPEPRAAGIGGAGTVAADREAHRMTPFSRSRRRSPPSRRSKECSLPAQGPY